MSKPDLGSVPREVGAWERQGRLRRFTAEAQLRHHAVVTSRLALVLLIATCCATAQITVPASGIINTVVGAGDYTGDGGAATSARLNLPANLAMDSAGNIYIADGLNNCVRKVTIATGVITTIAGNPAGGFGGDGGPAISARLEQPQGIALDPAGNVYIADTVNNRIRKIAPLSPGNPSKNDGFEGYTFFPLGDGPGPYSNGNFTDVVANTDSGRGGVPATIQHELRHVFLGDFGRTASKAIHGTGNVDQQTKAAEDEAIRNQKGKP